MSEKDQIDQEFALFQALPQASSGKAEQEPRLNSAVDRIRADLVTSKFRLTAAFLMVSLIGYILTLIICSQSGVSFFGSDLRSEWLMSLIPHQWCAVICGSIFNGIPALTALLLLNRFQRRYLLFRMPWLLIVTPLLGCGALSLLSSLGGDESGHFSGSFYAMWLCSALVTPYVIEGIAALKLRQPSLHTSGS